MTRTAVWVPPRWARVLFVTPVVLVGAGVVTLLSPLLHLVLLVLDLVDRREWRFSRLGGIGIALCVTEFFGLIAAFVLWVVFGFGRWIDSPRSQRLHNRVFGLWLEFVTRALRFYLGFQFTIPPSERIDGPVLTLARHAGPGDAFLLARTVIRDYGRQLRMLGASKLLWDPFLSHMMLRLPHHFIDPKRDARTELDAIAAMCGTMGADSVAIIFPEGGNWTPRRRDEAIEVLTARGQEDRASLAAEMVNVLPPRTAGALAAIGSRDDMTLVFVAHAGLGDLHSIGAIWRNLPLRRNVQAAYWSVPSADVPSDRILFGDWLYERWAEVDNWVAETRPSVFLENSDPATQH